jgi:hypothetical protein
MNDRVNRINAAKFILAANQSGLLREVAEALADFDRLAAEGVVVGMDDVPLADGPRPDRLR